MQIDREKASEFPTLARRLAQGRAWRLSPARLVSGLHGRPQMSNDSPEKTDVGVISVEASDQDIRATLPGRLDEVNAAQLWGELTAQAARHPQARIRVDAQRLAQCTGAGVALLAYLSLGKEFQGRSVEVESLPDEVRARLEFFSKDDYGKFLPREETQLGVVEEFGRNVRNFAGDFREQLEFLGALLSALPAMIARPRLLRWGEIRRLIVLAGVNALPIISLMSLLVGFIIAFESASAFAIFGAEIYMANMLGIVITREMAPLLTAVMVTGRSGSAFAAELGTMKVNEELNALLTMGLDPVRFLVVQRVIAGMVVTPLLTVYAVLLGLGGGVVVMVSMGFPVATVLTQMESTMKLGDLTLAVTKGFVFGAIISLVGCLRGLQTARGPAAVGASTTRAVVAGILLIILADAVFSVIAYAL